MPINQPIPLSQERKKGAAAVTVLYTDCSAHLPYRTYMYNHQQAVGSRPMKKIKTKGKKEKKGRGMEKEEEERERKNEKEKEKAISGAGG